VLIILKLKSFQGLASKFIVFIHSIDNRDNLLLKTEHGGIQVQHQVLDHCII
jgi:hypothetical protein